MMRRLLVLGSLLSLLLTACGALENTEVAQIDDPTATLLPIVTRTPRYTATPVPTRTPIPTFTNTPTETSVPPSPTLSLTPTMTPTITGIVQSLDRVNVRVGPAASENLLTSLPPGTGVQILGQNADASWYRVRLEDGREGWMASRLLFVAPTSTPFPTSTPSPDLTALFLGTPLPTRVLGGGTVTPTPPSAVRTGSPEPTPTPTVTEPGIPGLPIIDTETVNETATALVSNAATSTPRPTQADDDSDDDRVITVEAPDDDDDSTAEATSADATATPRLDEVDGRDVFAFCNEDSYGINAPTNLRDGAYIDIWWGWFASTEQQVQDHIDNVNYELRVNGEQIENVNDYVREIEPFGSQFVAYWYVPYGPLPAGDYEITYVATWEEAIQDGSESFGPGTDNPFNQEACSITVFERP